MKNFRLKYFVLALVIATQWSCAVDEGIKEADKAAAATNGFEIEPTMKYFIDGQLTYDYDAVKVAAVDAWNIHFDGPKRKVVISSTKSRFEEYLNSNPILVSELENNKNQPEELSSTERTSSNSATSAFPSGYPNTVVPLIKKKNLIGWRKTNTTSNVVYIQYMTSEQRPAFAFARTWSFNTNLPQNGNALIPGEFNFYEPNVVFHKISLNNESSTANLTKTFYKEAYYDGASVIFTAGPNKNQGMNYLITFKPKSII